MIQERPRKFYLMNIETKEIKPFVHYRTEPIKDDLFEWVSIDDKTKEYKQVYQALIDTRYEAKLRLWKYINFTKKGVDFPKYEPFKNTEIGKSIAILEF